jgi:hypothetical protein
MLLSLGVSAQESAKKVSLNWGPGQEVYARTTLSYIIGQDETGIYTLKSTSLNTASDLRIDHYNEDLSPKRNCDLDVRTENDKRMDVETITMWGDSILLFCSYPDFKKKSEVLCYKTISKKSLCPTPKKRELLSLDFKGRSKSNVGNYTFKSARDSSKLIIKYDPKKDFEGPASFGLMVLNRDLTVQWDKQIEMEYESSLFKFIDLEVDTDGNAHVIAKVYRNRKLEQLRGEVNFDYHIFSFTDQGELMRTHVIDLEGRFITDSKLTIDDKGDVMCTGFYSANGIQSIKGNFFLRLDAQSGEQLTLTTSDFDIEFMTEFMTDKENQRMYRMMDRGTKEPELFQYVLDELILDEDGGVLMIAEQFYTEEQLVRSFDARGRANVQRDIQYRHNDIIVIRISAGGITEWNTKIPKRQTSLNDNGLYSSYSMVKVADRLYFVYNDHPNNLYVKKNGQQVTGFNPGGRESMVTLAILDKQGRITRTPLIRSSKKDLVIRPKVSRQVNGTDLILFGQRKRIQKFGRVRFEE